MDQGQQEGAGVDQGQQEGAGAAALPKRVAEAVVVDQGQQEGAEAADRARTLRGPGMLRTGSPILPQREVPSPQMKGAPCAASAACR